VIDLAANIGDFADTAAIMAELDLIITVDTAAAHLAGALGRPVWTLRKRPLPRLLTAVG
jgi:ADP-heptose:LPS heptosyltransferase